jgi:hypothetical protein
MPTPDCLFLVLRAEQHTEHWHDGLEPPPPGFQLLYPIQTKVVGRVILLAAIARALKVPVQTLFE